MLVRTRTSSTFDVSLFTGKPWTQRNTAGEVKLRRTRPGRHPESGDK